MLDYLISVAGSLGYWGYLVIFLVVALECQAVLGLVMPGESLVLVGGFFAGQGVLDPGALIVVITIAAILGDSIGYKLGRQLGRGFLLKHGSRFGLRQEHLDRVDGLFAKHGGKAVFGSHFLHLLRPLMPFVAGERRMHYRKFVLYNALGCIVWASVFVSLGYVAGESWRRAAKWVGVTGKIVGGGLLLAIALVWLWRWRKRHEANNEAALGGSGGTSAVGSPASTVCSPTGMPSRSSPKVNQHERQRTKGDHYAVQSQRTEGLHLEQPQRGNRQGQGILFR